MTQYNEYRGFTADDMDPKDYYGSSPSCLFKEVAPKYSNCAIYTMDDRDKDGLLSARRIYMASTSEYEAAMKLVGSWQGWLKLTKLTIFDKGIQNQQWGGLTEWREEMKTRDQALAKVQLMKSAITGNVSAQRALYDTSTTKPKRVKSGQEESKGAEIVSAAHERLKLIKK